MLATKREAAPPGPASELQRIGQGERRKMLSSVRLKLSLSLMVIAIITVLMGLIWLLVGQIFDRVTPSIREDLLWKTERGVVELSLSTELGIVTADAQYIDAACARYVHDRDVMGLLVTDVAHKALYSRGEVSLITSDVFRAPAGQVVTRAEYFGVWRPVQIEGLEVGNVALLVSTQRLHAGLELRSRMLAVAAVGLLTALLLALGFVNLRIMPVLRMTEAAFAALEEKTQAALESARLKGEFLANVSHEIRTPLNGIIGIVTLMREMHLAGLPARYLQVVDVSARALLGIVNDVLDFSKIEADKLEIRRAAFDPRLVTQEVAELSAGRAHDKGLELLWTAQPSVPATFWGDGDRFRQVLGNLVGNAIKFTESGQVVIGLAVEQASGGGDFLRAEVEDSGIGIDAKHQALLFQAFSQVDGSSVRNYGGTGLGLAISKRLVQAMGGEIGVESAPGEGSKFWFRVPLERPVRVAAEPRLKGTRRVLVVDGNDSSRAALCEQLERWGVQTHSEASGLEGLDLLALRAGSSESFDAVLVAEKTRDITGIELVGLAGSTPSSPATPLVLLRQRSAGSLSGELVDAVRAELDKPIRASELYKTLLAVLEPRADVGRASLPATPGEPAVSGTGRRVLIVDDNEINRFVAAQLVSGCGYAPAFAENGKEAIEAVCAGDFALVLMDCQMPVMDGYEATRQIRAHEGGGRTPIVAVTAHALSGERDKCLKAGMDDYMTKPIHADSLSKLLARWSGAPGAVKTMSVPSDVQLPALSAAERSPELIELFLSRTPALLSELSESVTAGAADRTGRAAHKLKGSCLAIAAPLMADTAAKLQRDGERGELERARESFAQLRTQFAELERLLRAESLARDAARPHKFA
jgi:signal transduction histidine kinase/DNA-binding response OmpR family regulator/HPt (histidine-containing phosphotransfer) domain-containing protein